MDDYQELIERLRNSCEDAVQPDDVYEAADLIEQLQAENERLKHNLTTTEQTMREYQELAAKRLEEIERLKSLSTTLEGQLGKRACQNNRCLEYNRLAAELAKHRDAPVVAWMNTNGAFNHMKKAEQDSLQAEAMGKLTEMVRAAQKSKPDRVAELEAALSKFKDALFDVLIQDMSRDKALAKINEVLHD